MWHWRNLCLSRAFEGWRYGSQLKKQVRENVSQKLCSSAYALHLSNGQPAMSCPCNLKCSRYCQERINSRGIPLNCAG